MKIGFWNLKGLGSGIKSSKVSELVHNFKIDILLIQETKLEVITENLIRRIWFDDYFGWVFAKSDSASGGKFLKLDFVGVLGNVYAPYDALGKKAVWDLILNVKSVWEGNWCLGDDFNTVRSPLEKKGCLFVGVGGDDFNLFIDEGNFLDLLLTSMQFTWFRADNKRSRFKNFDVAGRARFCMKSKLANLKGVLKAWNKEVFGDVNSNIEALTSNIDKLDKISNVRDLTDKELSERRITLHNLWVFGGYSGIGAIGMLIGGVGSVGSITGLDGTGGLGGCRCHPFPLN
ncbi:hypothetical protein REPUB_Repub06bG0063800 [Reevesia pubescens]